MKLRRHKTTRRPRPLCEPLDPRRLLTAYAAQPDLGVDIASDLRPYNAGLSPQLELHVDAGYNAPPGVYRPTVSLYLSADKLLSPDDTLVTSVTAAFSSMSSDRITVDLPGTLSVGTYYPIAVVDPDNQIDERDETNNIRVGQSFGRPITVIPPGDLTPTAVDEVPSVTHVWVWRTPEVTISLSGVATERRLAVRFVLTSDDVVGNGDDITLADASAYDDLRSPTPPASLRLQTGQIFVRGDAPLGTFRVGVILDPLNEIPETDESNNTLLGPAITIRPYAPDLAITAPPKVYFDTTNDYYPPLYLNPPFSVVGVTNLSDIAPPDGFTVDFYFSSDPTLSPDDVMVGTDHQYLPYGSYLPTKAVRFDSLAVPHVLGATWYPIAVVRPNDRYGQTPDADPSNNTTVGEPFTIPATRSLAIGTLEAHMFSSVLPPDYLTVHGPFQVLSTGYFPSDTFTVHYYLSADDTLDDTDIRFATRTYSITSGPGPGPVRNEYYNNIYIPTSTPVGTYRLAAVIEGSDAPPVFAAEQVFVAFPDPAVPAGPTFSPPEPGHPFTSGDTVTVSFPITNDTDAYAPSVPFKVYLSTDPTYSGDDVLVYTSPAPGPYDFPNNDAVGPRFSGTRTASFQIPYAAATTTYYPIVVLDPAGYDLDRSNNVAVGAPVVVEGSYLLSLTLPTFTGPTYAGTPATLSFTVTNVGARPSPVMAVSLSYGTWPYTALDPITIEQLAGGASRTITAALTLPDYVGWYTIAAQTTGGAFFPGTTQQAFMTFAVVQQPIPGLPFDPPPGDTPTDNPPPIDIPQWWTHPDVSLFSLTSPASVTSGSALRLFTTPSSILATGFFDPVFPFDVAYFLSANDAVGDADDIPLGTVRFTSSDTISSQVQSALAVPASVRPGTYRLIAVVDPDNAVDESGETNNVFTANTVTVLAPTLTGSLSAPTLRVGAAARLNLSLAGAPGQPAGRRKYAVSYYFSDDAVFSPGDTLFSKQTIDATLAAGGKAKSFAFTAKVPTNAPVGTRHLIAVIDGAAAGPKFPAVHLELATKPVKVLGPHLTASVFAVRATGRIDTAKVTVRVANYGNAAAAAAPVTVRLLGDNVPLLTIKKSVSLKAGKYVDYTFTVRRSVLSAFTVTIV